jgi:hypothetical protein
VCVCFSQTHQLLYKIILWQQVSAPPSRHQALNRTDPQYITHHNAFWDIKRLQRVMWLMQYGICMYIYV